MDGVSSLTCVCSSSCCWAPPRFFLGVFNFLDMDPGVLFLNGSSPPPELLPYLEEDMMETCNKTVVLV